MEKFCFIYLLFIKDVINSSSATVSVNRFYVIKNCNEYEIESVFLEFETKLHAVRCCNHHGNVCYSHIRNITESAIGGDHHCFADQTYKNAKRKCETNGLRLCTLQEIRQKPQIPTVEQNRHKRGLSVCCTTGCDHDLKTVWTSSKENDTCAPSPCPDGENCTISETTGKLSCLGSYHSTRINGTSETNVLSIQYQQNIYKALLISLLIIIASMISGVLCYRHYAKQKKQRMNTKSNEQSQKFVELSDSSSLKKASAPLMIDGITSSFDHKIDFKSQLDNMVYNTKREIDRDSLDADVKIGSGNFGEVYKGTIKGLYEDSSTTIVAIKTSHGRGSEKELKDFLDEIKLMSNIKPHPNLVSMIGSCSTDFNYEKKIWLVIEICEHGDLKTYLTDHKASILSGKGIDGIDSRCLIRWSYDIARGMEYLQKNRIMHGDLAARNVLMGDDILNGNCPIAKIADFGLAKNFYTNEKYEKISRLLVPWRWMAIEYLKDDFFTLKSDVWSYGVTLWEILSFGRTPYGRQEYEEVLRKLESGYQLSFPDDCKSISSWSPEQMYKEIAGRCFVTNPDIRQSFSDVVKSLEIYLTQEEKNSYSRMNEMYQNIRAANYLRIGKK